MYRERTDKRRATVLVVVLLMGSSLLSGCTPQYASSYKCKNPQGIGCSSIFYADLIARKHIILNSGENTDLKKDPSSNKAKKSKKKKSNKVVIREHYADFEKFDTREVEID